MLNIFEDVLYYYLNIVNKTCEFNLKRLLLIFSGFLPRTLKGEAAENQPPFRDGAKLIFSGCEKCVFLDRTHVLKTKLNLNILYYEEDYCSGRFFQRVAKRP